jgi:hypothetical protein
MLTPFFRWFLICYVLVLMVLLWVGAIATRVPQS